MMLTELRDYQQEMVSRLEKAWKRHRSVMVQMPTGTGKTVLMAAVIRNVSPVLIVAHRRELIEQIRETIDSFGIEGVYVESIQRLARDAHRGQSPCAPKVVIIDEAHHALAETYRGLWERWPKAKFLGLTATPCRLSGEPFTDLFDTLLQSWTIQEFIDRGYLSDFEYVSAAPDNRMVRKVRMLRKRSAGDFQEAEMAAVLDETESIEHLYRTYRQYASGKKGIVYAINRKHAQHIAAYYREKGVRCAVIDSRTPAKERAMLVEAYRLIARRDQGAIDVLVNVDIFGEGFDVPEVEFIQLARPTLSLSKYLQQVGRGMRVSKGKAQVVILDNVGLYQTFGLPTADRDWRQMFLGKTAGRGCEGRIVLTDEPVREAPTRQGSVSSAENQEMVRIKRGGQKGAGLEIFLQGALFGVMLNGKVTCPAKFREVVRIDKDSQFYALGIFTERYFTVIDKKGQDMGARFYGDTYQIDGDFVCGDRLYDNGLTHPNWWDSKTGYYYEYRPQIRVIHGMEFACTGRTGKFRRVTGAVNPEIRLINLYYNRFIALNKKHLVVRKDHNHAYNICGYLGDSIIVKNDRSYGYLQIFSDGTTGKTYTRLPEEMMLSTDYKLLGVKPIGNQL